MTPGKTTRGIAASLAAVLVLTVAAPAPAVPPALQSALLPGLGQAQQGRYTKAALFASAAVLSAAGLFAAQINYARSVEKYEDARSQYITYGEQLDKGEVVYIGDIRATEAEMQGAWDEAESRQTWRNGFAAALVATYALNIVDVILSKPDTGEANQEPAVSIEWRDGGFRVARTFGF